MRHGICRRRQEKHIETDIVIYTTSIMSIGSEHWQHALTLLEDARVLDAENNVPRQQWNKKSKESSNLRYVVVLSNQVLALSLIYMLSLGRVHHTKGLFLWISSKHIEKSMAAERPTPTADASKGLKAGVKLCGSSYRYLWPSICP